MSNFSNTAKNTQKVPKYTLFGDILVILPQYNLFAASSVQWRDLFLLQFNVIAIKIDENIKSKHYCKSTSPKTFKFSYIKPDFWYLMLFVPPFFHIFISIFHFENLNELSSSKWVSRYAWIEHRKSNFKYLQIWLLLALFGYFWDWKMLSGNSANMRSLILHDKGA